MFLQKGANLAAFFVLLTVQTKYSYTTLKFVSPFSALEDP